jgi:transcriptional regulator with XRE-family HTH domain
MGVSYRYLSQVSSGSRPWTPMLRERAMAVLGEVPGQGVVYRQGGMITGESTCIRERAREVGLSMGALADLVGVSRSYMSQASRGKRHFSPEVQAKVEAALEAPAKVEAAQCPTVDPRALWGRMDARGFSQNQVARMAGISTGHLSLVMNGQRTPRSTCSSGCTRCCLRRPKRNWWLR